MAKGAEAKTLDELVKSRAIKKDTTLYIGGREAFFWIGNRKQYNKEIDELSESMVDILRERVERKERTINHHRRQIELLTGQVERLNTKIDEFVPLRSRTIREHYIKTVPGEEGVAILIEGTTCGKKYWFKDECRREATT